jgi:hypothetical protein
MKRRVNASLEPQVFEDLRALQGRFGNISLSGVIQIAVKRLTEAELSQIQTAPSIESEEAA